MVNEDKWNGDKRRKEKGNKIRTRLFVRPFLFLFFCSILNNSTRGTITNRSLQGFDPPFIKRRVETLFFFDAVTQSVNKDCGVNLPSCSA